MLQIRPTVWFIWSGNAKIRLNRWNESSVRGGCRRIQDETIIRRNPSENLLHSPSNKGTACSIKWSPAHMITAGVHAQETIISRCSSSALRWTSLLVKYRSQYCSKTECTASWAKKNNNTPRPALHWLERLLTRRGTAHVFCLNHKNKWELCLCQLPHCACTEHQMSQRTGHN